MDIVKEPAHFATESIIISHSISAQFETGLFHFLSRPSWSGQLNYNFCVQSNPRYLGNARQNAFLDALASLDFKL